MACGCSASGWVSAARVAWRRIPAAAEQRPARRSAAARDRAGTRRGRVRARDRTGNRSDRNRLRPAAAGSGIGAARASGSIAVGRQFGSGGRLRRRRPVPRPGCRHDGLFRLGHRGRSRRQTWLQMRLRHRSRREDDRRALLGRRESGRVSILLEARQQCGLVLRRHSSGKRSSVSAAAGLDCGPWRSCRLRRRRLDRCAQRLHHRGQHRDGRALVGRQVSAGGAGSSAAACGAASSPGPSRSTTPETVGT